jgi:23S rRNA G2069 N7-methylase RlmK/C1962 C5-methylase RlmI
LVVEEALLESTGAQRVVWRVAAHMTMEGLDGATASNQEDAEEATPQAPEDVYEDVQVLDCGVKYMVGLMSQKTGFYCDQRDSRKLIRQYSANKYAPTSVWVCCTGVCSPHAIHSALKPLVCTCRRYRRVLDCCCYTGGFALNAAVGGATEVVGVDSSAPALERATLNAKLNHVDGVCTFELSDIKRYLQTAVETGAKPFDIIVRTLRNP